MEMTTEMHPDGRLIVGARFTKNFVTLVPGNASPAAIADAYALACNELMKSVAQDAENYEGAEISKPQPKTENLVSRVRPKYVTLPKKDSGVLGPVNLGRRLPHHDTPALPETSTVPEPGVE